MFDEGSAEYAAWMLDAADAFKGRFPPEARVEQSTRVIFAGVSPDGKRQSVFRPGVGGGGQSIIRVLATGQETVIPIPPEEEGSFWLDSVSIATMRRVGKGLRFGVVDVRTGVAGDWFNVPDSAVSTATRFPDGRWAWAPTAARTIAVQERGRTTARRYPLPAWFNGVLDIAASLDGQRLIVAGFSAPSEDSLGVAAISLADGATSHWFTIFGEGAMVRSMFDGSFLVRIGDTPEIQSFYRLRGPGSVEKLGTVPRPLMSSTMSRDGRRMMVVTRDYRGDAWIAKVVRR
jgi:hypothetical protein